MFKYIKKLTSVTLMIAFIIVFSTSKVFASTTISDGEKIYSVLTKLPEYKKSKVYNKKTKKLFIINLSLIVAHDLFPKKNDNKKINIAIDASSGEHAKNLPILRPLIGNLFNKPDANINISIRNNINHLPISNLLTNPYLFPPTKSLGSFCKIQIKAENGKFYDATKEQDGSYTLTVAGLAKFKKDKEEAEKLQAGGDGGDGGGC
ncbi:hypothetical protein N9E18_00545 [Candidatus Pelagibacter sp.]|nr:hypothetical protein [Candidatus Pelagibacter sp.]